MTDLEITRLCAEAMDLTVVMQLGEWRFPRTQSEYSLYDPLHDDAQAMALVKRFRLSIEASPLTDEAWSENQNRMTNPPSYSVSRCPGAWSLHYLYNCVSPDLNRAICECVAKMQAAK